MERRTVRFGGHVQGVGFRATTERFAQGEGLSGWVRNLPDGGVEMIAEGEAASIEGLLRRLRDHFQHGIEGVDATVSAATGEFDGFAIRY